MPAIANQAWIESIAAFKFACLDERYFRLFVEITKNEYAID